MSVVVSTSATRLDLDITAGDTFDVLIPILGSDDAPVEITDPAGWSARAHVRRNALSDLIVHEWTTGGAEPNAWIVPGQAAQVRLYATAEMTAAWREQWPDWTCGWDLELTEPDLGPSDQDGPTPFRIARGFVRLRPQYTR